MTGEQLYRKFGPKLVDAQVRAQLKFNNQILRHLGLPELTGQDVINGIANELENIPDYDWMDEEL
jgi:hypothetical protein